MPHDTPRDEVARETAVSSPVLSAGLERLLQCEPSERGLRRLMGALAEAVPDADSAVLLLREGDRIEVVADVGRDEGAPDAEAGGIGADAIVSGELRLTPSPGAPLPRGTRVGAAAPLRAPGVVGAIAMGSRAATRFAPEDLLLLRAAADRAALVLASARLERERDDAAARAARAAEEFQARRTAIDYILGIVGHDLRNPLGAVHMSAALLQKRGGLEGWQARTVERMRSSAGRMGRIIADLLSYTRTRLGSGIPIERRPADLEQICRKVVDELRAANASRTIEVRLDGDLRGVWDSDRLEQVASNLVSNAIDHGDPEAPIVVELRGDPEAVWLAVRNHGPALPPDVLTHLFEPFARGPEEQSRKGSGLGLGLYISREIVRGHDGEIFAASNGETVITVRLPRAPRRA